MTDSDGYDNTTTCSWIELRHEQTDHEQTEHTNERTVESELLDTVVKKDVYRFSLKNIFREKAFAYSNALTYTECRLPTPERIECAAFKGCNRLTILNLVNCNDLIRIERGAFMQCMGLKSLDLHGCKNLTRVDSKCFKDCNVLEYVNIEGCANLREIGTMAFAECVGLTTFDGINNCGLSSIGISVFRNTNLIQVDLPASVTSIKEGAFESMGDMDDENVVTLPVAITSIGNFAFNNCPTLTLTNFPSSVRFIGRGAFMGCASLKTLDISQNNIASINSYTFAKCNSLETIRVPQELKIIGEGAFEGCSSLTAINIEETKVEQIYSSAFEGCSRLIIILPLTILTVEHCAFSECNGVKWFQDTTANMYGPAVKNGGEGTPILPDLNSSVDDDDFDNPESLEQKQNECAEVGERDKRAGEQGDQQAKKPKK